MRRRLSAKYTLRWKKRATIRLTSDQLVGYLLSGDPTYITSHKDSRTKLRRFERYELLEELVKSYLASAAKK